MSDVNVLAVMDGLLAFASRGVESDDPARPMIEAGRDARAAVAELIEADKALDRLLEMRAQTFPVPNFRNLVNAARLRRELALARVGGAS